MDSQHGRDEGAAQQEGACHDVHDVIGAAFKAKVALAAIKGETTPAEPATARDGPRLSDAFDRPPSGMLTAVAHMDSAVIPIARDTHLELQAGSGFATRNALAARDVADAVRLLPLAWTLGWLDIRLRYRGSLLGPLWLTISTGVMVGALGFLYAGIFHTDVRDYLPYLALSLVLWGFLNTVVSEACSGFTETESVIRAVRMPFFMFAIRVLIRNVLVLAHNIVVIAIVFVVFQVWPGWHALLAIPGLAVWAADSLALVLLLGTFCARFRDIQPIVGSVMQIAFFVSPVFWKPGQLGGAQVYLPLNPIFDFLEIVRTPLLGGLPEMKVWLGATVFSLVLWGLAWTLFTRARARIAFWI